MMLNLESQADLPTHLPTQGLVIAHDTALLYIPLGCYVANDAWLERFFDGNEVGLN